jgi:sRNA-binding protein
MTRDYETEKARLRSALLRWQSAELNERQVHEEAERIWAQGSPWPELPDEHALSIVAEVARILDSLNSEWVTVEDVPTLLSFLDTPPGDEARAWSSWRTYWNHVDFSSRRHDLEANPYYAKTGPFI